MDSKMNIYLIKSKYLSIVIILSVLVIIIFSQLGQSQAIIDFSYGLHEFLNLPVLIGMFLIPLEAAFAIYYFTRWVIGVRKSAANKSRLNIALNLTAILSLVLFVIYFNYMSHIVYTSGIYEDLSKENHKNKYYIVVQNKLLSCTRNEYNLIDPNEEYLMSYAWNKYSPNIGKLTYIEKIK